MSNINKFFKQNKKVKKNTTYAATQSLLDDNGKPLEFTIRPITTRENEKIRSECTDFDTKKGMPGDFKAEKYVAKLLSAAIVEPNLNDAELQNSYEVMTPEDLLVEMIDNPKEYQDLILFVQNFNGFTDINVKVEEAKN